MSKNNINLKKNFLAVSSLSTAKGPNYANNTQKIAYLGWVTHANCQETCIVNIPEYDYKRRGKPWVGLVGTFTTCLHKKG